MNNPSVEKIKMISEVLKLSATAPQYLNNRLGLSLHTEFHSTAVATLEALNVPIFSLSDHDISFSLTDLVSGTEVYYQELNFRQRFERSMVVDKDIAVLDYKGSWLFYDHVTGATTIKGHLEDDYLVENAAGYYDALEIFQSNHFADYVNTLNKVIVLYSSTKGIKKIQVPDYVPAFDASKSITTGVRTLLNRMQSADFTIYFRNELFGFSPSAADDQLKEILTSLPEIITLADNQLQLYLKNFSFDKLKTELGKEKDKYFASLRDILAKNLSQLVGIPISFSASVFATYKVNNPFILAIILVAFLCYSAFTYYIQTLYLKDVAEIEEDFNRDFHTLTAQSGLPLEQILVERHKIERRIGDIRTLIRRFRYLLIGLTGVFVLFIAYQAWHK